MKKINRTKQPVLRRWLDVEEIRLVADLRIMHSKVAELSQIVSNLKRRHSAAHIHKYADQPLLNEDIARADDIYRWFVGLKGEEKARKPTSIR
jgi:hypothetical protein